MTVAVIAPRDLAVRRRAAMIHDLFGDLIGSLVAEDGVTDITANSDGKVWVTATGRGKRLAGTIAPSSAEALIFAVANSAGEHVGKDNPAVAAEVSLGDFDLRFQGFIPPVTLRPEFILRKPFSRVITLAEYREQGVITARQFDQLERAVADRKNIIISGGTGTGKSTMMNALLGTVAQLTPGDRVGVVERTRELLIEVADKIMLRVTRTYSAQQALQDLLRAFITRIMVGEVRGAEALEMLMAWNTGHDGGFCTIHSKTSRPSPRAALLRLEQAAALAATTTPLRLQPMVAEVVDLVVCIALSDTNPAGRVVSYIGAVNGWNNAANDYEIEKDETA